MWLIYRRVSIHFCASHTAAMQPHIPCYSMRFTIRIVFGSDSNSIAECSAIERKRRVEMNLTRTNSMSLVSCVKAHKTDSSPPRASMKMCCWFWLCFYRFLRSYFECAATSGCSHSPRRDSTAWVRFGAHSEWLFQKCASFKVDGLVLQLAVANTFLCMCAQQNVEAIKLRLHHTHT